MKVFKNNTQEFFWIWWKGPIYQTYVSRKIQTAFVNRNVNMDLQFCAVLADFKQKSESSNQTWHDPMHGQRTSRESFFSKIWKFWAWADKLGWHFGVHFGYFQPNYWHYFGTVSPLFMGKCSWIFFLQKMLVFKSKTYNSQILPK